MIRQRMRPFPKRLRGYSNPNTRMYEKYNLQDSLNAANKKIAFLEMQREKSLLSSFIPDNKKYSLNIIKTILIDESFDIMKEISGTGLAEHDLCSRPPEQLSIVELKWAIWTMGGRIRLKPKIWRWHMKFDGLTVELDAVTEEAAVRAAFRWLMESQI